VAELLTEMELVEKTICVTSIGCSVFLYNYLLVDSVEAPHGRAPAVATGVKRARPDNFVLTYQGDGDLASIGMAERNIANGGMVNRVTPDTAVQAVRDLCRAAPDTDAVFVSCTALRLVPHIEALEQEIGKPIVTSNQALAWHCLRLGGVEEAVPGFGRLLRLGLV
jgi:hypothetical protein